MTIRMFVLFWIVISLCQSPHLLAQTPDESQLPTTRPPAVIPPENQLPTAVAPLQDNLPDEAALPGFAPDATATERESSLSPGTLRPWLRLRFDGHTGVIRSLGLSQGGDFFVSAGEDKDLHLWARQADVANRNWFHRRLVRWQIERGPRGRIYATATQGNLVAMAGHGATGALGEIWIVDATTGNLVRSLVDIDRGHRQVVASLAWRPRPADQPNAAPALASIDVEGRALLWTADANTGIWSPRVIVAPDRETYGADIGAALASRRRFVPLAFFGPYQLMMPRYVRPAAGPAEPAGAAIWQLQRYNLTTNQSDLLAVDHVDMVTAMTASDDGKQLATADAGGRVWHWTFGTDPARPVLQSFDTPQHAALAMDFSDSGKRLLVGRAAVPRKLDAALNATLEWFDTSVADRVPIQLSALQVSNHVWGCAYDDETSTILSTDANRITVHRIVDDKINADTIQTLAPPVGPVRRVAFAPASPPYRVAIASDTSADGGADFSNVFDLSAIRLEPSAAGDNVQAANWVDPNAAKGNWDVRLEVDGQFGERNYLYEGETKRFMFPLLGELHGLVSSTAWLDDSAAKRSVVILGTDGRNNLYAYELVPGGEPKLLRQFRGHGGTVMSIGVSPDGRYAVSGSDDATACVWKIEDMFNLDEVVNRWGASFEVRDDRVFAIDVRKDGPLYFRGVRDGDQLVSMDWIDGNETAAATDPKAADSKAILDALSGTTFDTLVVFQFSRFGRRREAFQSFPVWQSVATFFVDRNRQWAIWTPAGFYDASFGGNDLFGWQINRGISTLPEYFRAAQFRQRLENPAAMRRLMSAGDLSTAMENSISGIAPPPGEGAIVNQILSKPTIRLVKPAALATVTGGSVEVEAEITVPRGSVLQPPKAFAGGVPAINRELLSRDDVAEQDRYVYKWTANLPSDDRVLLEIIAATDAGVTDRVAIDLLNESKPPSRLPRMYFLAIGVSQYADPQIQKLDFAARGAGVMADLMRDQTTGLYRTTISQLTDSDAIRPLWRDYTAQAARELSGDVGPDDLVVMYLCGHGLRDRRTNQWYFVTADARYNDLMNDRYDDLLSFADLALLGELPCRKLAIIDSCHSGAVQPVMRSDDLKAAMRMLQGDVVLTITASEGEEEAAEQEDRQLGRFTSHLVDALGGQADQNADGIVTLRETIDHIIQAAAADSKATGFVQHPTAGPADLLQTLQLPLTKP